MTEREKQEAKLMYEINSSRDNILEKVKEIREHAVDLKKEMDDIIRLADQITENVEESIHFPTELYWNSSWEKLPIRIAEADTMIKGRKSMMRVYNLTASLSLDTFDENVTEEAPYVPGAMTNEWE